MKPSGYHFLELPGENRPQAVSFVPTPHVFSFSVIFTAMPADALSAILNTRSGQKLMSCALDG